MQLRTAAENVITSCEPTRTATVYPSKREPSPCKQENLVMTSCEETQWATIYPSKSRLPCIEQKTPMHENMIKVLGFELLNYAFKL
ncbi:unnamed protein product [Caenorhabditis nigoni]